MRTPAKSIMGLASFIILSSVAIAQEPTASPTSSPVPEAKKNAAEDATKPAPEPTDFWTQETMTGDWGGTRSRWKEKGVELNFKLSQFVQGTAAGGLRHDTEYNGKFEMEWKFDLAKVAGWKFWSTEIKTEFRYGGAALGGTGGINPVNTAAISPGANGEVVSITAFNFTRLIPKDLKKGDLFVVSFGRFNLLDLIEEDFFAGGGTERFWNMAQIGPLTVLREVPLVTNGINFAYVKGGEPFITLGVLDPNDHTLDAGIDDLFADGVSFVPAINFGTKYGGKSGKHTFGGAITTKKYTPFDALRQVIIPGPPLNPVEPKRGSWSLSYTFRQYFVERAKKDGWGFFTQVAVANKDTSPIARFIDVGLGGNGLFEKRRNDEFGISYAYSGLSSVLNDNINLVTLGETRLQAEHQVEMFYNFHITPWLQLTGDLQIIRGVRPRFDTAVVPGARLVMIF